MNVIAPGTRLGRYQIWLKLGAGGMGQVYPVVLMGAGVPMGLTRVIAPANPVNFASHIRGPTLMVQGRYDEDSPLRTAAEPLFKLLAEPKELFLYDGGHVPPTEIMMKASSGWLDDKLGRVVR